jgi:hypothetical protein
MTASNQNSPRTPRIAPPLLDLHPVGEGRALARALARVIVRQQLNFANSNADAARCDASRAAG